MSAREMRLISQGATRPEDALPPFTDERLWEPWGHRLVTLPAKVALDAHPALVAHMGHAGAFKCSCPLARAIFAGREPGK